MVRVTVSEDADRELRHRIGSDGVAIVPGPAHESYCGVEWTADDDLIAPMQRWVLLPTPVSSFDALIQAYPNDFSISEIRGLRVCVFFPPKAATLRIELDGDAIHVREVDA
jgi:hypothetical protein